MNLSYNMNNTSYIPEHFDESFHSEVGIEVFLDVYGLKDNMDFSMMGNFASVEFDCVFVTKRFMYEIQNLYAVNGVKEIA